MSRQNGKKQAPKIPEAPKFLVLSETQCKILENSFNEEKESELRLKIAQANKQDQLALVLDAHGINAAEVRKVVLDKGILILEEVELKQKVDG